MDCVSSITPAPHGTEMRPWMEKTPFPSSGGWGAGEPVWSQFPAPKFGPGSELFLADILFCVPGIHKQGALVPLPFSPPLGLSEGRTHPPWGLFFFFFNHNSNLGIFLPLPAPPKLSVGSALSTWTSLPCPSNPCENPTPNT